MVLQDAWLFGGTIYENIRYGKLDATEEQIMAAAKATFVDRFVRALPEGYDTVIDEEGNNVSAGEKQLITIARAFVANPSLLILDEATSSVDTRTEVLVQKAMAALRTERTSFVIAHRLSTIRDADTILVMEAGRIVEQGRNAELLELRGAYYRLYMSSLPGKTPRRRCRETRPGSRRRCTAERPGGRPAVGSPAAGQPDGATEPRRLEVKVPMRWGDMDAYGHINNVQLVRILEEARIAAFGPPRGAGLPGMETRGPLFNEVRRARWRWSWSTRSAMSGHWNTATFRPSFNSGSARSRAPASTSTTWSRTRSPAKTALGRAATWRSSLRPRGECCG